MTNGRRWLAFFDTQICSVVVSSVLLKILLIKLFFCLLFIRLMEDLVNSIK